MRVGFRPQAHSPLIGTAKIRSVNRTVASPV
jgi:hypothetical protein